MTYDVRLLVHTATARLRAAPACSLTAVAAECGVSRHTLLRAFQRCGCCTPGGATISMVTHALPLDKPRAS